jgi:hypothetical protein
VGGVVVEWLDWIIKIAAVGSIIFGAVRYLEGVKKDVKETKMYVMNNIDNVKEIPKIIEHLEAQYLTCLRLTIMSKDMPLGERIAAGVEYLKRDGNGEVKKYLIEELHINEVQND